MKSQTTAMVASSLLAVIFVITGVLTMAAHAADKSVAPTAQSDAKVKHRIVATDGVRIFYREAGPKDAPAVLLMHGFPSSSHMFRHLIPALADRYHVVAPDYPGTSQIGAKTRDKSLKADDG